MSTAPGTPVMRRMEQTDLGTVMQIERDVYQWPWSLSNYEDALRHRNDAWVALATDGELVGYYVHMTILDEAHLLTIAVKRSAQRQGLGKYLMLHALAQAKLQQLQSMWLELRVSNPGALRLYQSCGFALIGRRKNYYRVDQHQREDALIMRCEISQERAGPCG